MYDVSSLTPARTPKDHRNENRGRDTEHVQTNPLRVRTVLGDLATNFRGHLATGVNLRVQAVSFTLLGYILYQKHPPSFGDSGSSFMIPVRPGPPPHDDDDGDDEHHHHHHQFKHLNVSLVGRRVSSAHLAGSDYRFIDQ